MVLQQQPPENSRPMRGNKNVFVCCVFWGCKHTKIEAGSQTLDLRNFVFLQLKRTEPHGGKTHCRLRFFFPRRCFSTRIPLGPVITFYIPQPFYYPIISDSHPFIFHLKVTCIIQNMGAAAIKDYSKNPNFTVSHYCPVIGSV